MVSTSKTELQEKNVPIEWMTTQRQLKHLVPLNKENFNQNFNKSVKII
jgi:hypothetical protein